MNDRDDIAYGVSVFWGPFDGWDTLMVTSSKRRAWEAYRSRLTDPTWDGIQRIRILEWRDGICYGPILESDRMSNDWKRL